MPLNATFKVPEAEPGSRCQIMPFHIGYTGVEKNSHMPVEETDGVYTVYFRGKKLQGAEIEFPGYKAVQVDVHSPTGQWESVKAVRTLESYIIYELGTAPDPRDPWGGRINDLLEMSNSIKS